MFGNGSDENENDKDERFLENGFGIKKLFGQVNKAKEKYDKNEGSFSIDLSTEKASDREKRESLSSQKPNQMEEKYDGSDSFEPHQSEDVLIDGEKFQEHLEADQNTAQESHQPATLNGEAVEKPTSSLEENTNPVSQEEFLSDEPVENYMEPEEIAEHSIVPFEAEPNNPHIQTDETEMSHNENNGHDILYNEGFSDDDEEEAPLVVAEIVSDEDEFVSKKSKNVLREKDEKQSKKKKPNLLTKKDLRGVKSARSLLKKLKKRKLASKSIIKLLESKERSRDIIEELERLQLEMIKFQKWIQKEKKRAVILFEGLDSIENRSVIKNFVEYLDPRAFRVVALSKPTKDERDQMYFHRYMNNLPREGEIVFFDRSWYDRAIIEPANKLCSPEEYGYFLKHAPEFERMLSEDGIELVKFWFSVSKKRLLKGLKKRKKMPLFKATLSSIDSKLKKRWADYKHYKELMFSRTHSTFSPWTIVKLKDQKMASIQSIKHFLSHFDYDDRDENLLKVDEKIIYRCKRPTVDIS